MVPSSCQHESMAQNELACELSFLSTSFLYPCTNIIPHARRSRARSQWAHAGRGPTPGSAEGGSGPGTCGGCQPRPTATSPRWWSRSAAACPECPTIAWWSDRRLKIIHNIKVRRESKQRDEKRDKGKLSKTTTNTLGMIHECIHFAQNKHERLRLLLR